jgi:hypothetical protein
MLSFIVADGLFSFFATLLLCSRGLSLFQSTLKVVAAEEAVEVAEGEIAEKVAEAVALSTDIARPERCTSFHFSSTPQIDSSVPCLSDSDKKVSQSWGGEDGVAELKVEDAATADATAEKDTAINDWAADDTNPADDPWGAPVAPSGEDATALDAADGDKSREHEGRPRREREPEEEDNTLTLEQYLAQKKEQEASLVPKLEGVRKANEGADHELWKDVIELKKDESKDAYFVGKVGNLILWFHLDF